jgi:alpha-glucuronidase
MLLSICNDTVLLSVVGEVSECVVINKFLKKYKTYISILDRYTIKAYLSLRSAINIFIYRFRSAIKDMLYKKIFFFMIHTYQF